MVTLSATRTKHSRRRTKTTQVLSHPGSATSQAVAICGGLGAQMSFVESIAEAYTMPMDRLLLLGGSDINPWLYGQRREAHTNCDSDRDKVEWALVRRAMSEGVPILGICRGHQMITIAYGGTLYQDMGYHLDTIHSPTHRIIAQGALQQHIPTNVVNSYHHQCANVLPYGFEIAAVAEDNVIEAIYRPGVLGVQWHPEMMVRSDTRWMQLFRWFIEGELDPTWIP